MQKIMDLFNYPWIELGCENKYHCRGKLDDDPPDPSDPGCQRAGRCGKYTVMSVPGNMLIIILQMFRHNK